MAEKKKTFLLFLEQKESFPDYTDEELGKIFRAVYEYVESGAVPDFQDRAMKILFATIRRQLDSASMKYEETCKKRAENQHKRWEKQKSLQANSDTNDTNDTNVYNELQDVTNDSNTNTDTNTNYNTNANTVTDTNTNYNNNTVTNSQSVYQSDTEFPERQTDRLSKRKTLFFDLVLFKMGSELAENSPKSEADLSEYDIDDREVQACTIPYEFLEYDWKTMQEALKFLTGFSNLPETEFKCFADTVIQCLAEAVFSPEIDNPRDLIDAFNVVNRTITFGQWLEGFSIKYSKFLAVQGDTIRNRYAHLKACAVNYLREYRASEIVPNFKS